MADVVAHELSPRSAFDIRQILPPPAPKVKAASKPKEEPRVPKPPMPPAPKVPDNWLELSKSPALPDSPDDDDQPPKPVPVDDWSLIRLKTGRAGWVLSGSLKMNIPDEVAQYSEGRRITSYFATGDVNDNGQVRHHWLWTTLSNNRVPYEFDSFRYFIWNLRKHRYETAYVERNLKGYYPTEVRPVQVAGPKQTDTFPGFSVVVEENGIRYRKTYSYQIYLVHLVSKEKIETPAEPDGPLGVAALARSIPNDTTPLPSPGFFAKLKDKVSALKARWLKKK